jgi:hypothetical protein
VAGVTSLERTYQEDLATERDLIFLIATVAQERGWEVATEVSVGPLRPDFILKPSPGFQFVGEVKREVGPIHFASLSQVTSYRNALTSIGDGEVVAMLVSTGRPSDEISRIAGDLGVLVIAAQEGEPMDALVDRCIETVEDFVSRSPASASLDEGNTPDDVSLSLANALQVLLQSGRRRSEISDMLEIDERELASVFARLITITEASEPERVEALVRAWAAPKSSAAS